MLNDLVRFLFALIWVTDVSVWVAHKMDILALFRRQGFSHDQTLVTSFLLLLVDCHTQLSKGRHTGVFLGSGELVLCSVPCVSRNVQSSIACHGHKVRHSFRRVKDRRAFSWSFSLFLWLRRNHNGAKAGTLLNKVLLRV
jgi:hypothetical protein